MDSGFGLTPISSQYPATQLVFGSNPPVPVMVYNFDTVNSIYVGDNAAIQVTDQHVSPIGPQSTVTFDGTEDVYAIAPAGESIQVFLFPSAFGINPSPGLVAVEIAQEIATTGVSFLAAPKKLYSISRTIAQSPNSQILVPISPSPIAGYAIANQLGYELNMTLVNAAAATNGYAMVDINFYDDDDPAAIPIDITTWFVPVAASGGPCVIVGKGPMRGQYISVDIQVPSPGWANAGSVVLTMELSGVGRAYSRDSWREVQPTQTIGGSGNTARSADYYGQGAVFTVGKQSGPTTIAAGASTQRVLPLYSGRLAIRIGIGSGAPTNQMGFHFYPQNTLNNAGGSSASPIAEIFLGNPTTLATIDQWFPHDLVNLFIQNNTSAANSFWVTGLEEDY